MATRQKAVQDKEKPSYAKTPKDKIVFNNFSETIISEQTRYFYETLLHAYMRAQKFNAYSNLVTEKPEEIQQRIITFIGELRAAGKSSSGMTNYIKMLKHLYTYNDILTINWKKVQRYIGERKRVVRDKAYELDDVRKMLDVSDERKKMIILLFESTGIRRGAIPPLKLKHLKKLALPDGVGGEYLYQFSIYENTSEEYIAFCTPECAYAIDAYLDYRRRYGETLGPESPLLRDEFNVREKNKITNPKHLTDDGLKSLIHRIVVDAGVRTVNKPGEKQKRHEHMLEHAFRKLWKTKANMARLDPVIREKLLGHTTGLDSSYFRPTEQQLFGEYLKLIEHLTVSQEKQLVHEVEKLKVENADIDTMKKSYLDMKLELQKEREERARLLEKLYESGVIKKE